MYKALCLEMLVEIRGGNGCCPRIEKALCLDMLKEWARKMPQVTYHASIRTPADGLVGTDSRWGRGLCFAQGARHGRSAWAAGMGSRHGQSAWAVGMGERKVQFAWRHAKDSKIAFGEAMKSGASAFFEGAQGVLS